jgi:hypothetical protein
LLELRPLRQKYQESLPDYEANKRIYDSQVEMIESTLEAVSNVKFNLIKFTKKVNKLNKISRLKRAWRTKSLNWMSAGSSWKHKSI